MKCYQLFRLAYLDLTLTHSKGQVSHMNGVSPIVFAFLFCFIKVRVNMFKKYGSKYNCFVAEANALKCLKG